MNSLEGGHRARINIKNTFVADIVITPIKGERNEHISGYMVMLMDVTTQAEEERRIKETIKDLSVPILQIWDNAIALPLVGNFDVERGEILIPAVLEECTSKQIRYVMVSLAGINHFDESVRQTLQKLHDSLRLLGVQCIVVGIKPQMARSIVELNNIMTFRDAHDGCIGLLHINRAMFEHYEAGLAEGGHEPGTARVSDLLPVILADDPEAAWPRIAPHVVHQMNTYRLGSVEGTGHPAPPLLKAEDFPEKRPEDGSWATLEVLTPEEAAVRIHERIRGLPVRHLIFWASIAGMPDDLVARHIELVAELPKLLERQAAGG